MTEKEWMNEGIDVKLLALLYRKKLWISIVCGLAGAMLAGGLYAFVHVAFAPAREYEGVTKLYLRFAADDNGDAYQYYNGYTWNDLMHTDPILDKIMEELPSGTDREATGSLITADILSDIRVLTVTVRSHDPAETDRILIAAENALIRFGQEMREFEKIEALGHNYAKLVVVENETLRAVAAGAVIGFLLSLLALAFARVMDDSVYVPSDFEKRYPYPVLGVEFAGNEECGRKEMDARIDLVSEKKADILYVDTGSAQIHVPGDRNDTDTGIILRIPYGGGNGKLLERWIAEVTLSGKEILGAVITDADMTLYRLYFAPFGRKKGKRG